MVIVPTPIKVAKYLDDPAYEHEDFSLTCVMTLRARVSGRYSGRGLMFVAGVFLGRPRVSLPSQPLP